MPTAVKSKPPVCVATFSGNHGCIEEFKGGQGKVCEKGEESWKSVRFVLWRKICTLPTIVNVVISGYIIDVVVRERNIYGVSCKDYTTRALYLTVTLN